LSDDWAVAKGTALEDIVAGLLRSWGFDAQTRIRPKDKSGVEHEIDVLGRKKESFGDLTLAVECKNHIGPIDIKEIRNFNDKLSSLGYAKGLFISVGGFTIPALQHAKAIGLEIWDSAALKEKLNQKALSAQTVAQALPLAHSFKTAFAISSLDNGQLLQLSGIELAYTPYYFIGYHCFAQDRVQYEIKNVESKGFVIMNATHGQIVDSMVESGVKPTLPSTGYFSDCNVIEPREISRDDAIKGYHFSKFEVASPRFSESQARQTAQLEITKNIAVSYMFNVHQRQGYITETKTVRPRISDVGIIYANMVYVPLITEVFTYRNKSYKRIVQAATVRITTNELRSCNVAPSDNAPPKLMCVECGSLACERHSAHCLRCGKSLCTEHTVSKGFVLKKSYCRKHAALLAFTIG
jgi:hypothetical protein